MKFPYMVYIEHEYWDISFGVKDISEVVDMIHQERVNHKKEWISLEELEITVIKTPSINWKTDWVAYKDTYDPFYCLKMQLEIAT